MALRVYAASQFFGSPTRIDDGFAPHLDRLNEQARKQGVRIFVTSSFRVAGQAVRGAVVPPAQRSNHLVGHAIDMNLQSEGRLFGSAQLAKRNLAQQPAEIQAVIQWIRADRELRWGGDFGKEDPIHVDDGLNLRFPALWADKFAALQRSGPAPASPRAAPPA